MTVDRRAGAPRLIEWTGERCVPWTPDVQVIYEHYHRYLWAAELVRGKRVLDLASGEGFGSALLAGTATSVCGVDIDEATVEHSRLNYVAPNLEFRVASALDLEPFLADSFDVVVAFEMIEHVSEHDRLLEEIDRVMTDDGIVVLSTPDRRIYTEALGQRNPFHLRELSEAELRALLRTRFNHVALWGQRATNGSRIASADGIGARSAQAVFIERAGDEWEVRAEPTPLYLLAVASHADFEAPPAESNLFDYGLELMRVQERIAHNALQELERSRRQAAAELRALEDANRNLQEQVTTSDHEIDRLSRDAIAVHRELMDRAGELEALQTELARIENSVTWSMFQKARGRLYGKIGEDSRAGRSVQRGLQALGRHALPSESFGEGAEATDGIGEGAEATDGIGSVISFPTFAHPLVSLVIPVHAQASLTAACLRSIVHNTAAPSYEVVIVDDTADDATKRLLTRVRNAKVLVNEENLGFLRSMNRGCAAASGRYVVLFNNDTEVQPGWLEALVSRATSAPDIGAVAPMLLYPDGGLQEAGSIVFRDGSAWNFGKGHPADSPEYNYVRDIDYASAACLLVRTDVYREIGGFDERYAPIYYEDTDLCFAVREQGYRVIYEPAARVVHVEGATSGTDTNVGSKRYQVLNQPKFVEKWRHRLQEQHHRSESAVRRAANRNPGPHVLVIDDAVPASASDFAARRLLDRIESLLDLGCRITFLPDDRVHRGTHTHRLQAMGVEVLYGRLDAEEWIASTASGLRLAIVRQRHNAARYLPLLRAHAAAPRLVYEGIDLYGPCLTQGSMNAEVPTTEEAILDIELAIVRMADATIVATPRDRDRLVSNLPEASVVLMPTVRNVRGEAAEIGGRSDLVFLGDFDKYEDVDAAIYLVQALMPRIWRELGDVTVTIVGLSPPPEVQALGAPGVEVVGSVEGLQALLDRSRVMMAPLRKADLDASVTLALAAGLPIVTTSATISGSGLVPGEHLLLGDSPEDFAASVVRLYRDDALWRSLSEEGQQFARRFSSSAVIRERLSGLLDAYDSRMR